jgi:hypothetical protein
MSGLTIATAGPRDLRCVGSSNELASTVGSSLLQHRWDARRTPPSFLFIYMIDEGGLNPVFNSDSFLLRIGHVHITFVRSDENKFFDENVNYSL